MTSRTELYALLVAAETLRMVADMEENEHFISFPNVTLSTTYHSEDSLFESYINRIFEDQEIRTVPEEEKDERVANFESRGCSRTAFRALRNGKA